MLMVEHRGVDKRTKGDGSGSVSQNCGSVAWEFGAATTEQQMAGGGGGGGNSD
jgi:hypothetical protein